MRLLLFLTIFLLVACAQQTSTQGISYIDPSWQGQHITDIAVEARSADLRERRAIEYAAVEKLDAAGIAARASVDIFLPTRDYTDQARHRELTKQGLRHILLIEPTGKLVERSYTPPERGYGIFGYGSGSRSYSGIGIGIDTGLTLEEPIATYHVTIKPLGARHALWVADFTARGPTGMSFDTLGQRLSGNIVRKLQADGLI